MKEVEYEKEISSIIRNGRRLETHEIIRVMVYNTGMNIYVWKNS